MATRYDFSPLAYEPPSSSFAPLTKINERPALAFDAAADEAARWSGRAPQGLTAPYTLVVQGIMASATSGAIGLQAQLEAITPGDSVDLDATSSFDTVNNSSSTSVPATAGYLFAISITMTNADSIAAGDYFRLSLNRDGDGSAITDSAAGDFYLLGAELRDAA